MSGTIFDLLKNIKEGNRSEPPANQETLDSNQKAATETGKIDKVILTNLSALTIKYGDEGVQKIQAAVNGLIAADKSRGLITCLYNLDDAAAMQQFGVAPVIQSTDPQQNKDAVDAIYKALAPDYVFILGAVDIIPHQDLKSPLYSADDPDEFAWGDIPYACESAYSQKPKDFFGPTRVVGRLPDITGGTDPQYLLDLLKIAADYKNYPNADPYRSYFGVSAEIWKGSTTASLSATFGNSADLQTVPPHDHQWPAPLLGRRSHFINCHGALNSSQFYGQPASGAQDYPVALDALDLQGNISEGTITAAECCYGAQLFDPALNIDTIGQKGIANTYLANQAYAFFGSTTIAYGAQDGNIAADLICQYFLQSVLQGASLGRAALEARQRFIHTEDMSDPSNIKTLAQYNLYADPSITPIKRPQAVGKHLVGLALLDQGLARAGRRRDLFSRGLALALSQPIISKDIREIGAELLAALRKTAADHGLILKETLTFNVKAPDISPLMPKGLFTKEIFPSRIHVIFGTLHDMVMEKTEEGISSAKVVPKVITIVALIAKEIDGNLVSVKKIFSR
jgi:hypothetical protein